MKKGSTAALIALLAAAAAAAAFALGGRKENGEERPPWEPDEPIDLPNVFDVQAEPQVGDSIAWMVDRQGPIVMLIYIDRGDNIDDAVIAMAKANPSTGFVLIPDALSDLVAGDQAGVDKFCGPSDNLAVAIGSEFGDPDVKLVCFGPVVTADEIREHVEPALFGVG